MRHFHYLVLLCLLATPVAGAEPEGFRLSGLVVTTDGRNLALIELPDGEQLLLREGDTVGGKGEVLAISRQSLRVRFPEGEQVFYLSGYRGGSGAESRALQAAWIVRKKQDSADGLILNREVAPDALLSAFEEHSAAIDAGKFKELAAYLVPLLDLPSEVRIVGVDHAPVTSVKEAIELISTRISAGNVVKLNMAGDEQVYLSPH